MKTLTDNDVVSTSEITKQLRLKGIKKPFGVSQLTTEILLKKGFSPVIKIREGSYWSRDVLNKVIDMHTIKQKASDSYTQDELVKAISSNFSLFGDDVREIKTMLNRIITELNIK